MSDLPSNWIMATLGTLTGDISYGTAAKCAYEPKLTPVLRIPNIANGKIDVSDLKYAHFEVEDLRKLALQPGDILVIRSNGSLKLVGRTALVGEDVAGFLYAGYLIRLRFDPTYVLPAFVHWLLQSPDLRLEIEGAAKSTSGVNNINGEQLRALRIPLPPLAEQQRIVAKLDALTARTARARADLDRVPVLADLQRRALLAAVFEGRLSRSDDVAAWESRSVGSVIEGVAGGKNLRCEERPPAASELGVVKVSAVTWGRFNPDAAKTLPADYSPAAKALIRSGDLLISRANTLELVGAVALVGSEPGNLYLSDKVLRIEMPDEDKPWLMWFLRSPQGRAAIQTRATGNQLSMRNLSQDALRAIDVPWPEANVRKDLVRRIDAAFAEIDRLVGEAATARRLLDRLDQTILAKAFRGELVPQDPADEPASALLERLRAERAAAPAKARRGRPAKAA